MEQWLTGTRMRNRIVGEEESRGSMHWIMEQLRYRFSPPSPLLLIPPDARP